MTTQNSLKKLAISGRYMNFKKKTSNLPISGKKYQSFKGDTDYKVSEPRSKSGKSKGNSKKQEATGTKPGSSPTIVEVEDENQYGESLQPTDTEEIIQAAISKAKNLGNRAANEVVSAHNEGVNNLIKFVGDFISEDPPQRAEKADDYGASFEYGIEPNPIKSTFSEIE